MTTPISFSMNVHRIVKIEITELQEGKTDNHWRWINLIDKDGQTHSIAVHGDPEILCGDWKPRPPLLDEMFAGVQKDLDALKAVLKPEAE